MASDIAIGLFLSAVGSVLLNLDHKAFEDRSTVEAVNEISVIADQTCEQDILHISAQDRDAVRALYQQLKDSMGLLS